MRVLVAEGEMQLAQALVRAFHREGIEAEAAYDGKSAVEVLSRGRHDVVVLDADAPGRGVCRALLLAQPTTRVLVLSINDSDESQLASLAQGASDHLAKPFQFSELMKRVRVLAGDL
jgi:DNA-binding response OmpR family regulator